ncbi:unnamed protein product [Cylindrotheca closterium]|uniref:Helicase-associated domain-containing protein n=1 Tax=Cylindrotheca closterium TaxID=2856 RepID=A0AAD2FIK1_9STRA|nr:unnamed protein product [Cylindrotheca closterium]
MIFTADNDKLHKDSESYSDLLDEGLLSFMECPLPSFQMTFSSSSYSSSHPAICFEDPFDDPSMEPIPIGRPNTPSGQQLSFLQSVHDASSSFVTGDVEGGLPPSSLELNNKASDVKLRRDLIDILGPIINTDGTKRSCEASFTNINQGAHSVKRQRTSHMMQASPAAGEESTARFRPYQEAQWQEQFQKLVQYKLTHGHCCVPHSCQEDPVLARWVKRQRYQYKKFNDNDHTSTMTTRRIRDLESLGFVWKSHASAWEEKFNELKAFKHQRGHCNVPAHYPENTALSTWVKCQRRQYKLFMSGASASMTMGRLRQLKSVDFVFDASNKKVSFASTCYAKKVGRI